MVYNTRMGDRRREPTWKWATKILLTIIFALGTTISSIAAYTYVETKQEIKSLDKDKVDTKVFIMLYEEVKEMRVTLKEELKENQRLQREANKMLMSHIIESGKGRVR